MNASIMIIITSVVVGIVLGYLIRFVMAKMDANSAELRKHKIIQEAKEKAESERKHAISSANSEIQKERHKLENENRDRRAEIQKLENRVLQREANIDKKSQYLEDKERNIENKMKQIKEKEEKLERIIEEERKELEKISGFSAEEAKNALIKGIEEDAKKSAAKIVDNIEKNAIETGERKAREIIVQTIQRISSDVTQETSVTSVSLPSEEMKGRIIGREGRNIRMLETLTGVDIIIDDTPEAVVISCFDPVRKHIAKVSLEKLILDGRIHPARIEEVVEKTRKEVEDSIISAGENAIADLNLTAMHHELVRHMGRLQYRTSYGQNMLLHSKEVANIAAMIAAEIGADVEMAKRGAFLHDIGKAIEVEGEGSHAMSGADLAKRCGEKEEIVNSIRAHHNDVGTQTVEAVIVKAADAISAARPGARMESFENYIKRLDNLEKIADSIDGVEKSFAIQAGRELRVMAKSDIVDDAQAKQIARDIAKRIEDELKYPGVIRVTVIRETRAVEVAR
ncbi:ribonuclease Y [Brachyspira aalborgi]|uniref:Ribonuclease Y n=1 Tax=Brachyspira aalborgi TaxID=29522 RepID=A0A5C8ELB8_9SPIR|nr:ribonuclease Y [Brachyspira aalborgi]TXJ20143.1 ribonuclease Y [Brachyspira aalborgi]TXJ38749.1 ribonuclease Y [Brachyspira aalborgi]TXJ50829.1 ribonuclease Y [Brachyspira aalborgi]TXJ58303.1 ribonuclease Y [Brachyspira aalborgi]